MHARNASMVDPAAASIIGPMGLPSPSSAASNAAPFLLPQLTSIKKHNAAHTVLNIDPPKTMFSHCETMRKDFVSVFRILQMCSLTRRAALTCRNYS
jgi:hypothetical protein